MCGKQRTLSPAILEVWQAEELRVDFSDVWQEKGLEEVKEAQEVKESGEGKYILTADSGEWQASSKFQNGKNGYPPRHFSQEWQTKDLEDTELGRTYGEWEVRKIWGRGPRQKRSREIGELRGGALARYTRKRIARYLLSVNS